MLVATGSGDFAIAVSLAVGRISSVYKSIKGPKFASPSLHLSIPQVKLFKTAAISSNVPT